MKKNNKGFTLVELIVVIAILGVLMAVLVPQYIQYVEKSRIGVDESYIGEVAHTMEIVAAGNESLYGKELTITLTAGSGKITEATDGDAKTMYDELVVVFPGQPDTVYKSKEYKTGGAHAAAINLVLDANGKVTIEKGLTKNVIGNYGGGPNA